MRGIFQFVGQVLSCPVAVVNSFGPMPTIAYIVDRPFKGYPDFFSVGSVSQGQLGEGVGFHRKTCWRFSVLACWS